MKDIFGVITWLGCGLWLIFTLNAKVTLADKDVFQVNHPVPPMLGDPVNEQKFLTHEFANSWNDPYTTDYSPPDDTSFTHVYLEMKSNVDNNQFDRLGHIFINNVEIWRPSTVEPGGQYTTFSFTKDVSAYAALFRKPQKIAYMMNNVIDDTFTGKINVDITVKFYKVDQAGPDKNNIKNAYTLFRSADTVSPLQPDDVEDGHFFKLPNDKFEIQNDALSKDTYKAVLDVFASGDDKEEFWYSHLLDDYSSKFSSDINDLGGHGPCRQVDVYIDDDFAGYAHPYPVVYTGGLSPAFWSPIVSIKAYEVPSYQIDVTPFLAKLQNGATIKIQMNNGFDTNTDNNWLITASLLSWSCDGIEVKASTPSTSHKPNTNHHGWLSSGNSELSQVVGTSESVENSAQLTIGSQRFNYKWKQDGKASNVQGIEDGGTDQSIAHAESGTNTARVDDDSQVYKFKYAYSITASTMFIGDDDNNGYNMSLSIGYSTQGISDYENTGQACYSYSKTKGNKFLGGYGNTEQQYQSSTLGDGYKRHVKANNNKIEFDRDETVDDKQNSPPTLYVRDSLIELTADKLLQQTSNAKDAKKTIHELFNDILGVRDIIAHTDGKSFANNNGGNVGNSNNHWFVRSPFDRA